MEDINIRIKMETEDAQRKLRALTDEMERLKNNKGWSSDFQKFMSGRDMFFNRKGNIAHLDKEGNEVELSEKKRQFLYSMYAEERKSKIVEDSNRKITRLEERKAGKMQALSLQGGLSMMFFGMSIQRTMDSLLNPAEDLVGVFDVMSAILTILFLPAALFLLEWVLLPLLKFVTDLPEPARQLVSALALILLGLASLVAFAGQMILAGVGFNAISTLAAGGAVGTMLGRGAAGASGEAVTGAGATGIGLGSLVPYIALAALLWSAYQMPMIKNAPSDPATMMSSPSTTDADITAYNQKYSNYTVTNNFNNASASPNTHGGWENAFHLLPIGIGVGTS